MCVVDVAPAADNVTAGAEEQYDEVNLPVMCTNNVVGVVWGGADVAELVGGEVPRPHLRLNLFDTSLLLGEALNGSSVASNPVNLLDDAVCREVGRVSVDLTHADKLAAGPRGGEVNSGGPPATRARLMATLIG